MNRICTILNLRNHLPFGKALEYFGWCDVYATSRTQQITGLIGPNEDIDKLKIDFRQYDVLLLQHENRLDEYAARLAKKQNPNIVIIGNQHGYYKSILQIKHFPPDSYDYWNTWGQYWLDRSQKVLGRTPKKWINIGSYLHSYYYKTKKWQPLKKNKKALVIYEPNTNESYQDPKPELHSSKTDAIIKALNELDIPYDIKAHPLWANLKGNDGQSMWKPPKKMKDFAVDKIINYSLILGSRSTLLFDAIAMGIPVIGIAISASWEDDEYAPQKLKLFPYTDNDKKLPHMISKHFNKKINYNSQKVRYFLGDLNQTDKKYLAFCLKVAKHKKETTSFNRIKNSIFKFFAR